MDVKRVKVGNTLQAGQTVRFDGEAVDKSVQGSMLVTVIDPHSNAHLVTHTDGRGRQYADGFTHIPQALVEHMAYKGRAARQFTCYTYMLQSEHR